MPTVHQLHLTRFLDKSKWKGQCVWKAAEPFRPGRAPSFHTELPECSEAPFLSPQAQPLSTSLRRPVSQLYCCASAVVCFVHHTWSGVRVEGVKTNLTLSMTFTEIKFSILPIDTSAGGRNAYKVFFYLCRYSDLIGNLESQVVVVFGRSGC